MDIETAISLLSLSLSVASFSWVIYEKILLRPRTKVVAGIVFVSEANRESESLVEISLTNYGPGEVVIESIFGEKKYIF